MVLLDKDNIYVTMMLVRESCNARLFGLRLKFLLIYIYFAWFVKQNTM